MRSKVGIDTTSEGQLLTKTVFQYQFKLPGEEKEWVVNWDYQIGLVRMTGVFKCCKYNKVSLMRNQIRKQWRLTVADHTSQSAELKPRPS